MTLIIHEDDCNGEARAYETYVRELHPEIEIDFRERTSGIGGGLYDEEGNVVDWPDLWEEYCNAIISRMVTVGYGPESTETIDVDTVIHSDENAEPTSHLLDDPGAQEWSQPCTLPDGRHGLIMWYFTEDEITEEAEDYPWDNEHISWIRLVD